MSNNESITSNKTTDVCARIFKADTVIGGSKRVIITFKEERSVGYTPLTDENLLNKIFDLTLHKNMDGLYIVANPYTAKYAEALDYLTDKMYNGDKAKEFDNKSIWVITESKFEDIVNDEDVAYSIGLIDVIIDGVKDSESLYNRRCIDVTEYVSKINEAMDAGKKDDPIDEIPKYADLYNTSAASDKKDEDE